MKVEKRDEEEIKLARGILKVTMFKGRVINECPNCKHKGHFGSIITYECESENLY